MFGWNMFLSPFFSFSLIWIIVLGLYFLNLSDLLVYSIESVLGILFLILAPFAVGYFLIVVSLRIVKYLFSKDKYSACETGERLEKYYIIRTQILTYVYFLALLIEIVVEGYVPLFSMMDEVVVSQFDFGIPSLHGLVLALGCLLATANFYNYCKYKSRQSLQLCVLIIITFAIIVTRKMIIVSSLQIAVVYLLVNGGVRVKSIALIFLSIIVVSILFGVIGDIRTGRELFLSLSRPSFEYPEWLPSGLMWVYIYMVTPILNLTNAIYTVNVDKTNIDFICQLLPSVIRYSSGCVSEEVSKFDNAYQLSGAFNVATGYISVYLSQDKTGVIVFSFLHGAFCAYIYKTLNGKMRSIVLFSIVTQINLLMIFGNGFLNLNVVSQIPMALLFFPSKSRVNRFKRALS